MCKLSPVLAVDTKHCMTQGKLGKSDYRLTILYFSNFSSGEGFTTEYITIKNHLFSLIFDIGEKYKTFSSLYKDSINNHLP